MLNKLAFANSLAVLTAVLYVLFAILALVAPKLFQVLFDAQFFGANVPSGKARRHPATEECQKTFELTMTISEHEKGKIRCPTCKSTRVMPQLGCFMGQTAKKS